MKVIYTRYGPKEVPETREEHKAYNKKMIKENPHFIPLQWKCECDCHRYPVGTVMHFMPCC